MNAFSSKRVKNFSDLSDFYVGNQDPTTDGPWLNREPELLNDIFDPEFESYSEISVDSTSDSSWKYKIQGKRNHFLPRTCVEKNFMYGSSDGGSLSPFELPEVANLIYSEDDMSEIFPRSQTVTRHTHTMDEIEELRYLQELVHSAEFYSEYDTVRTRDLCEYDPRMTDDLYWNMELAQDVSGDYRLEKLIWDRLCEEERLRLVLSKKNPASIYRLLKQATTKEPYVTETTLRKCKRPESQSIGRKSPGKKKPIERPPSPPATNKAKLAKPCSVNSDRDQRVFLGGLPLGMTERSLRQQLAVLGYKVLKRPKILRGFAPEVLMRSVEEAKELVERGTITINGVEVEIRPFNSLMKQSESRKIPNVKKRSIFLGGLSDGTTPNDIQNAFSKMGIRIVNYPVVKFGFSRQVILETVRQAKAIIAKKKVVINGTLVDVRPFVRQSRKRSH